MALDYVLESTVKPASQLKLIATEAPDKLMRGAVARACNGAAVTGEFAVEWMGELTDTFKTELEDVFGYKVTNKLAPDLVPIPNIWIISWK